MTAQRWWVKFGARWIARIKSVQGQLNLFFTAISGISLASGALRYFGVSTPFIAAFLAVLAVLLVVYTYLYAEGGVWNQVSRDQRDMSANYSDPKARINTEMTTRGIGAALKGGELSDDERAAIKQEIDCTFQEYRNGIDEDTLENGSETIPTAPQE